MEGSLSYPLKYETEKKLVVSELLLNRGCRSLTLICLLMVPPKESNIISDSNLVEN